MHNSFQYSYSFLFSTCFGHPCAYHQEKITVSMRHWCLSYFMGGVWSADVVGFICEIDTAV